MNRRLKAKIIEHYGTQFMFSLFMGEHEAAISRVVRGKRSLSPYERKRWAEILRADEVYLFGNEGE